MKSLLVWVINRRGLKIQQFIKTVHEVQGGEGSQSCSRLTCLC